MDTFGASQRFFSSKFHSKRRCIGFECLKKELYWTGHMKGMTWDAITYFFRVDWREGLASDQDGVLSELVFREMDEKPA